MKERKNSFQEMPPEDDSVIHLDMSTVRFPSDGLSIEQLRKMRPYAFDHGFDGRDYVQPLFFLHPEKAHQAMDTVGDLLHMERCAVVVAYAEAKGIEPPELEFEDLRLSLKEKYVRLKLAAGLHEAEELVRGLEAQAAALAQSKSR
jgi:hypothetical protein